MPVYVRKNLLSISPESVADHSSHDEDFILDPDQLVDSLPQPFRLVNKIVTAVFDGAWEWIKFMETLEEEKHREIPVPEYEDVEVVDQFNNSPAVAESPDGKALFLGLPDVLIVLDPVTHTPITSLPAVEQETGQRSELTSISTVQIDVQTCLIISICKSGSGRLHFYSRPLLLLIKELETEFPAGSKILDGHAFIDGDFLGLTVEGKDGNVWLDILKLPKDSWLKALEDHRSSKPLEHEDVSSQPSSQRGSPVPGGWNIHGLAKPVALLRVTAPFTTVSATTSVALPGVNIPSVDEWLSTIGVGKQHQLTEQHLKLRRAAAGVELATYLGYQPKEIDYQSQRSKHCSWLVLNKGGKLSSVTADEQYLVCAWRGTSYLSFYNLHRTAKDAERNPDRVVPFGADVTALSSSPCGLLTVGLSDGSVILYDELIGLPLFSERVSTSEIQFLAIPVQPRLLPPADSNVLSDLSEGQVVVIAGCQDGGITSLSLDYSSRRVTRVTVQSQGNEDILVMVTVKSLQNVLLVMNKDRVISLLDFMRGEALCRLKVPQPYSINRMELNNVLSLATNEQQLLMKATVISAEGGVSHTALLAYKLHSFSCLDTRWKTLTEQEGAPPTLLHTTPLKKCIDLLLVKHLQNSRARQLRIQQRWESLRNGTVQR